MEQLIEWWKPKRRQVSFRSYSFSFSHQISVREKFATTYYMCEKMGGGGLSASLCRFKNKHTVLQSQNHA